MQSDRIQLPHQSRIEKNEMNKKKIYDAAEEILTLYDYDTVTIRNICKVSGVSYGSFYNLFDSKEEFLRFYLTNDFTNYMNAYLVQHENFSSLDPLQKSIEIFVCCAHYNLKKGIAFIRSFYSTKNYSLYPLSNHAEYSFTPLLKMGKQYLLEAQEQGQLKTEIDIEQMIRMYCYIFNGITFNWCLSQGEMDIVSVTKQILQAYTQMQQ